jgi:hypothetical protein
MYKANVYNVMIASPSDVLKERNIASEVVYYWNTLNSQKNRIVLLPICWETHSAPLMGERAQEVINKLVTDKADLLVGIFWTRIGTKTGDFESGTIEEIERHIENGKPAMLYFSDAPVRLDSVDKDQYEKLQDFKKRCLSKGLVETFDSIEDFRDKLKQHISLTIDSNPYFEVSIETHAEIPEQNSNPFEELSSILSVKAKELLIDCAKTERSILLLKFIGNRFMLQADKAYKGEGQRELAKWESVLNELESNDLIKDTSYKGESFDLTNKGYEFADYLNKINAA